MTNYYLEALDNKKNAEVPYLHSFFLVKISFIYIRLPIYFLQLSNFFIESNKILHAIMPFLREKLFVLKRGGYILEKNNCFIL